MLPNVTVTVAAGSKRMCQRATVKSDLGIASTDTSQDAKLDRLIVAASRELGKLFGRAPWFQTYQELLPGSGGHYLVLSHFPVLSISSITEGLGDSPTTVTASTYSIAGARDRVYREDGWSRTTFPSGSFPASANGPDLVYTATYVAGYVMPDQITEWSGGASVAANAWFSATDDDEPFIFRADATGGTTHASTEPTWPTVSGGTVTDNGITWTAYDQRLPQEAEEAAMLTVMDWFRGGLSAPAGIKSEGGEGWRVEYREGASHSVPPAARALISDLRYAA